MFFVPPEHTDKHGKTIKAIQTTEQRPVCLRNQHLILHRKLIQKIFRDDTVICMVYYPEKNQLMLAPYFNEIFRSIHKIKQYMLKETVAGEGAIPLHGILVDHQIKDENKELEYEAQEKLNILNVKL